MRVRTLLVAALAGGLLVAGSWAVATAASEAGVPRRDGSVIARQDAAEAPALAAATGASTKELMHRLGHASPRAALRYQHATEKRDEAIADGIDRILETPQNDEGQSSNVLGFRRGSKGR